MYKFNDQLIRVRGLGDKLVGELKKKNIETVGELLKLVPLRYEDRSNLKNISELSELTEKTNVTIEAEVSKVSTQYKAGRYGRQSIQRANASDKTGKLKLIWFNSPYVSNQVQQNTNYMLSGTYDPKYQTLSQPVLEKASADTIHTNRLVPIYSSTLPLKIGLLRRVIKHVTDNLAKYDDVVANFAQNQLPNLSTALTQLHFPDEAGSVGPARERLAIEEFLKLMKLSERTKKYWQEIEVKPAIGAQQQKKVDSIPDSIPFKLTGAQKRCWQEIAEDLSNKVAMNRLLIGDVGSGKTVVAGLAALRTVLSGNHAALIAPTKILASQHYQTLTKLFPDLELVLLTGQTKPEKSAKKPTLFVGTHAVINRLETVKPSLIIYDEQQRFGVKQRSKAKDLADQPHVLTMTATPIPRSLMLTIFSHLQVSHLDEMPPGRLSVKTWLVPPNKQPSAWEWVSGELKSGNNQVFVVCPFIDPSNAVALENVASAKETFAEVKTKLPKYEVDLLHGRLTKKAQQEVVEQVYKGKTQVLVTTTIVEVGIDLPQASMMVVMNPERFGLASLHQLRGRVGRAGQQGYCLLFNNSKNSVTRLRLKKFSEETDGLKLAELDLENRGSGDLFGTHQTGFSQLTFGSWTDVKLISLAKEIFGQLPKDWQSDILNEDNSKESELVLAN